MSEGHGSDWQGSEARVSVALDGAIGTITLNDPAKRNAFSRQMRVELLDAFAALHADDACRAIVLTGAGGTFCSGGDISEMEVRTQATQRRRLVEATNIARLMLTGPKPVIGAVEGAAMGAGLTLASACDYFVTADNARLCFAFTRVGLLPDTAAYWVVPRRVGLAKAQELFGLARTFDGAEAWRINLANEVAPAGTVLERARAVAAEYAAMPPVALSILKGVLANGFPSLDAAIQFELVAQPLVQRSNDHTEAIAAFREKRPGTYTGD